MDSYDGTATDVFMVVPFMTHDLALRRGRMIVKTRKFDDR